LPVIFSVQIISRIISYLNKPFVYRVFAAIGLTNQRETTIAWDRLTGLPLYNAIGSYTFCSSVNFPSQN